MLLALFHPRANQINDRQLQRIEILHLIHLNPRVMRIGLAALDQFVIGLYQQILEVEQMILLFVFVILKSQSELTQHRENGLLFTHIVALIAHDITIKVCMAIDIEHGFSRKFRLLHTANHLDSLDIAAVKTLGMNPQTAWMALRDLIHEMRQLHNR